MSTKPRYLQPARTTNRTQLPPDTRSDAEKAKDGVSVNHRERGRYNGGVGKPLR